MTIKVPKDTSWLKFYSIAILGGIGFTLSLFIGSITFETGCPSNAMIIASLASALFCVIILNYATKEISN